MSKTLTQDIVSHVSRELNIDAHQVTQTLNLLLDECTIPFIARYRKEVTGGLDEVQIRDIRDSYEYICALNERKEAILRSISEQGKLTDELRAKILACKQKAVLEDLYLPYKPKKRTRGQIAAEKGLAPIAEQILLQEPSLQDLDALFESLVGSHADLKTKENVIQGVKDYISEKISEIAELRQEVRMWIYENALFKSEVKEDFKEKKTKYNNYYEFSEAVKSIAGHRLMALRRGEKEEILKLTLVYDEQIPLNLMLNHVVNSAANETVKEFLKVCILEAFSRLLAPSIETEIRLESKNIAEEEAIFVFSKNLRNLLLLPPIPKRVVLGIDPGLRTGSKIVVVDKTGKLIEFTTVYPLHDQDLSHGKNKAAFETILSLIQRHGVSLISIGNGTAGREMEAFVEKILDHNKELTVRIVMVNEAGASVYSASDIAREEFPDLDISYRGAISIARRLQDPLAELVKIDPKSIGVGQYQHDVNQGKLKKQLGEVVESCVNYVGVNLNTASPSLLSYVAGIGASLAKAIVRFRECNGEFKSRNDLMNIPGFGAKTFEQSAGFLRIPESDNPLDNTAVHPETYSIIQKMADSLSVSAKELLGNKDTVSKINLENFVSDVIGLPTLQDILKELFKPGRDPREDGSKHSYNREIRDFEHLQEGQILTGTVTNVTNFGAFVDIGVHQDGLIHISELSNQFIKDVSQSIGVGDTVKVKVIGLDKERKRISLSKRACEESGTSIVGATQSREKQSQNQKSGAYSIQQQKSGQNKGYVERRPQNFLASEKRIMQKNNKEHDSNSENSKHSSIQDLLNKFNSNRA
jgi:uncharacterized protein